MTDQPPARRPHPAAGGPPVPAPRLPLPGRLDGGVAVRQRHVDRRRGLAGDRARWRADRARPGGHRVQRRACWPACCSAGSPPTGCRGGRCSSWSRRSASVTALAVGLLAVDRAAAAVAPGRWSRFLIGAAEAFFFPAYTALLPTLLPADELLAANGVEGMLRPVAQQALGPALAGLVVGRLRTERRAAAGRRAVRARHAAAAGHAGRRRCPPSVAGSSVLGELGEGFRYLFRTGWLFATLAFATLYVLVADRADRGADAVRGARPGRRRPERFRLRAGRLRGRRGGRLARSCRRCRLPRRYLTVMILLWGAGALPLVLVGPHRPAVADGGRRRSPSAFTGSAAQVIWGTLLQRRVPPHLLGRVSSLDFFVSLALMPVSMALAGPVGEWIGIPLDVRARRRRSRCSSPSPRSSAGGCPPTRSRTRWTPSRADLTGP